ncbi:MAG: helix-hairpin-helix domain-containing protein [Nitrospirae bacterium]|nr:MAG: helix-hairpin-helix domain-containing protein [Nitrospirota bacterium]
MVQSLLIKLAMLAAAVALVFWIGWPMPDESGPEEGEGPTPAPMPRAESVRDSAIGRNTIQPGASGPKAGGTTDASQKLDLNRATAGELEQLPGIGPVLAQRIVQWRRERGPFKRVDELNHVKGIGEKKLRQIRPLVTVGSFSAPVAGATPAPKPRQEAAPRAKDQAER